MCVMGMAVKRRRRRGDRRCERAGVCACMCVCVRVCACARVRVYAYAQPSEAGQEVWGPARQRDTVMVPTVLVSAHVSAQRERDREILREICKHTRKAAKTSRVSLCVCMDRRCV
jgi:hypothetical protein